MVAGPLAGLVAGRVPGAAVVEARLAAVAAASKAVVVAQVGVDGCLVLLDPLVVCQW